MRLDPRDYRGICEDLLGWEWVCQRMELMAGVGDPEFERWQAQLVTEERLLGLMEEGGEGLRIALSHLPARCWVFVGKELRRLWESVPAWRSRGFLRSLVELENEGVFLPKLDGNWEEILPSIEEELDEFDEARELCEKGADWSSRTVLRRFLGGRGEPETWAPLLLRHVEALEEQYLRALDEDGGRAFAVLQDVLALGGGERTLDWIRRRLAEDREGPPSTLASLDDVLELAIQFPDEAILEILDGMVKRRPLPMVLEAWCVEALLLGRTEGPFAERRARLDELNEDLRARVREHFEKVRAEAAEEEALVAEMAGALPEFFGAISTRLLCPRCGAGTEASFAAYTAAPGTADLVPLIDWRCPSCGDRGLPRVEDELLLRRMARERRRFEACMAEGEGYTGAYATWTGPVLGEAGSSFEDWLASWRGRLAENAEDWEARFVLADLLHHLLRNDEACEQLAAISEVHPRAIMPAYCRASFLHGLGRVEEAWRCIRPFADSKESWDWSVPEAKNRDRDGIVRAVGMLSFVLWKQVGEEGPAPSEELLTGLGGFFEGGRGEVAPRSEKRAAVRQRKKKRQMQKAARKKARKGR